MTELALVNLIFSLCVNGVNTEHNKLVCFDRYTNCAVKSDGKILTLKEFNEKCNRYKGEGK